MFKELNPLLRSELAPGGMSLLIALSKRQTFVAYRRREQRRAASACRLVNFQ